MRSLADVCKTIACAPSKNADFKRENANGDGGSSTDAMLEFGFQGAKDLCPDEAIPADGSKVHEDSCIHTHNTGFCTHMEVPAEGLCLAKGTVVQCVYGNKPIENVRAGDLLYSFNEGNGAVEIDRVERCWMTSSSQGVLKITFDTGQELVCTRNHPLARRAVSRNEFGRIVPAGGRRERLEWIEAGNVRPGMRIKSNYLGESGTGYVRVSGSGECFVHRLVYEYFTGAGVPDGCIVHHRDGNKKNNAFDNLELMTDAEHRAHHLPDTLLRFCYTSEGTMGEKNPFYGRHHTAEAREKISEGLRGRPAHNRASLPGVLERYKAGIPVSELQRQYGCATPSPIYRELKALGVKFRPSGGGRKPAVPTELLASSYYGGLSVLQIAERYGMSRKNVRQRLGRAGVLQPNHVVAKVEALEQKMEVWALSTSKNHSFYVGGDHGVLVHNSGRSVRLDRGRRGIIAGVAGRDSAPAPSTFLPAVLPGLSGRSPSRPLPLPSAPKRHPLPWPGRVPEP